MQADVSTQWPGANGPYFCEECGARYGGPGDCSKCPGEPLLDLRDPDVIHLINSFDDARWQRRIGLFTALSAFIVVPVVLGLNLMLVLTTGVAAGLVPMFLGGAALMAVISGGLMAAFPPSKRLPSNLPTPRA